MGGKRYLSYLLRLWQAGSGSEMVWRASLQSPRSRECRGFSTLEDLFEWMHRLTESAASGDGIQEDLPEADEEGGE
jgi:hypothetical protein